MDKQEKEKVELSAETIQKIKEGVEAIRSTIPLLSELVEFGIERIWPDRDAWKDDPDAGLKKWRDWVSHANRVDIISNTFWNNWLENYKFRTNLVKNIIEHGASVRLVIYYPGSKVQRLREEEEPGPPHQMWNEIKDSLYMLAELAEEIKKSRKTLGKELEIRLTYEFPHYMQLIRADEHILVALYLSGESGTPSPTIQLRGPHSSFFKTYEKQFNIVWNRNCNTSINPNELQKFVKQFKNLSVPSDVKEPTHEEIKEADLQKRWHRLYEKLSKLEWEKIHETRPEEKFRLEHSINETETELKRVEHQLDD